jgi:hypothetical protein
MAGDKNVKARKIKRIEIIECVRCPKVGKIQLRYECYKPTHCEHFIRVGLYKRRPGCYVACKYNKRAKKST